MILSDGLWKRRFASNPQIIGQTLNLSGQTYTVVGVMPPNVDLPGLPDAVNWRDQLWTLIAFSTEEAARRGSHYLEVIARMKPSVTLAQARAEMETIAARRATVSGEQSPHRQRGELASGRLNGEMRPALLVLLGAVGFVLLIACAHLVNLLLAQDPAVRLFFRTRPIRTSFMLGAARRFRGTKPGSRNSGNRSSRPGSPKEWKIRASP